jgi:hypothetical protein
MTTSSSIRVKAAENCEPEGHPSPVSSLRRRREGESFEFEKILEKRAPKQPVPEESEPVDVTRLIENRVVFIPGLFRFLEYYIRALSSP